MESRCKCSLKSVLFFDQPFRKCNFWLVVDLCNEEFCSFAAVTVVVCFYVHAFALVNIAFSGKRLWFAETMIPVFPPGHLFHGDLPIYIFLLPFSSVVLDLLN